MIAITLFAYYIISLSDEQQELIATAENVSQC